MPKNEIHFTKAVIQQLSPTTDGKTIEYCDDTTRGLRVRVTKAGSKSFYVLRKFKGKTERVLLGRFPETNITQAKQRALEAHSLMDSGVNPNENKRQQRIELTIIGLFDIYFVRHLQPHTKHPVKTKWCFNQYIKKALGSKRLSELNKSMVSSWHTKLATSSGKQTANRSYSLLRAMFNRAEDWDMWNGDNPTNGIKRFKEVPRDRLVTLDDLDKLFTALATEPNKVIRDFFMMLILTGARRGNVQSMHWTDINLQSGNWAIPETKNGEGLNVPLVSSAIAILSGRFENKKDQHEKSLFVFPGVGKSGHIVEPKKAWNRLIKRAELLDFRMHDLRHAFGSYLASTGANQFVIRDAMGHKDVSTTGRYVQMGSEVIKLSMERATKEMTMQAGGLIPDVVPIDSKKNRGNRNA